MITMGNFRLSFTDMLVHSTDMHIAPRDSSARLERRSHNPAVVGSNPTPATIFEEVEAELLPPEGFMGEGGVMEDGTVWWTDELMPMPEAMA